MLEVPRAMQSANGLQDLCHYSVEMFMTNGHKVAQASGVGFGPRLTALIFESVSARA